MDVWRITVAALRRWYVLVPLLALTALMMLAVGRGVQPEYDVTGTTMVVPGPSVPQVPNPYGGPDDANNAVTIVLNSPEARAMIADQGLIPSYEVSPQSRSTIMNFEVRGLSQQAAVDTGFAVFQMAATELRDRQTAAGIRGDQQYSIDVLQTPSVSATVAEGKLRNMAVVGVLGGALSLATAVFFDDVVGLLLRRRRRRSITAARAEADLGTEVTTEPSMTAGARATDQGIRPSDDPRADAVSRSVQPAVTSGHRAPALGSQRGSQRKPKQPRKVKKASASAGSRDGAASASRDTAVSDAP